ncbi:MAG: hypothetical protein MJZ23_09945 [Paludibacteraceae bacterium]|nr:hypothetical protein [Paludibacteraceae bacterium]
MKAKYLLFSLLSTTVLAQTETSFSGISSDSTRILLEDTDNNEDNSFAYFKTYVGKTNGDYWYLHSKPQLEDEEGLAARLHAVQFTRDAEYFLPETKGYTAVGFFVEPTLKYHTEKLGPVSVELGGQVLGIAGDDHRLHLAPIFRIEYQPNDWLKLVGGTIYGNLNHSLYEPMYDFDRFFYNNQEDGFQIFVNKEWNHFKYTSDTWINWENFLEPDEAEQEKFTIGSTNRFMFGNETRKCFQIPLDIMGTHRGGQFTALQDTALETLFNVCTGADWAINDHWRVTALVFGYKNNSNEIFTHFKDGYGLYPMLTYYNKNYSLMGGFWHGDSYIGTRGSHLFMSVSKYDPAFTQKERNMITGKWFYQHGIFGLESQVYYDLKEQKCDFSFGLYLKFDGVKPLL